MLNKSSSLSFDGKAFSCFGLWVADTCLLVKEESWVFVKCDAQS